MERNCAVQCHKNKSGRWDKMKETYDTGGDAVSLDVNRLNQGGLLESTDGSASLGHGLGTSVEAEGRRGGSEDGEEGGEGGDLHDCFWLISVTMGKDCAVGVETDCCSFD